jgi:hypothetical protein
MRAAPLKTHPPIRFQLYGALAGERAPSHALRAIANVFYILSQNWKT